MSLKPGTSTPQTFKVKVKGQLSGGENTVLGTRAELGTPWSLSGPGTGGECLMLQPRMTTDFLLLNTRQIFCTRPQPSGQVKANTQGQPASEPPFTSSTDRTRQSKSPNQQKLLPISMDIYSSLCSRSFGVKGLTILL